LNIDKIYKHQHFIGNGNTVTRGFIEVNTVFYLFQLSNNSVLVFNEKWEYQKNISFANNSLAYAIEIENELFFTGDNAVYKTDKSLNIINAFYNTGVSIFRGIYHNKTSDLIYVADFTTFNCISVFNRNLTFIEKINVGYKPHALTDYDEKLFVGTMNGTILVIQNKTVINIYNTPCNSTITSLLIDTEGYMIVTCVSPNASFIYHTNGTNTGKKITTYGNPQFINFDTKGRLIISSYGQLNIQ
jgi:DNA-binding beta-propeller fold protein YncE